MINVLGTIFYFLFLFVFLIVYFPIFALIWLVTLPFDPKKVVLHQASCFLSMMIIRICPLWSIHVSGKEFIDKKQSYVIVSNHQSMLDIPLMVNVPLNFKWVSKKEVYKMPIFGWVLWLRDDIGIERGGLTSTKKMLYKCKHFIEKGLSIVIYPEGTRSKTGRVNAFKEGGFIVAKSSNVPILPVVIDGTWVVSNHMGIGLKMPNRLSLTILEPIPASEVKRLSLKELTQLAHDRILSVHKTLSPDLYEEEEKKA
ncbi:MAG TPA: 1-acyl-sn-glycerol-3-phosphate acyltransferase [Candidatus Avirikenella pullistercoris]|nr:1-acyl-sn-glycerol-3-phosphate acyltransferase [Candidatus Avirikenella pullistercoris]